MACLQPNWGVRQKDRLRFTSPNERTRIRCNEGKILELHFTDGYSAVVKLLDVSEEHPGSDLIYDVLEVCLGGQLILQLSILRRPTPPTRVKSTVYS